MRERNNEREEITRRNRRTHNANTCAEHTVRPSNLTAAGSRQVMADTKISKNKKRKKGKKKKKKKKGMRRE